MRALCIEEIQGYIFHNTFPTYIEGRIYKFHFRHNTFYVSWGATYDDEIEPEDMSKFIKPIVKCEGGLLVWKKEKI